MKTTRRWQGACLAGLGLALAALTGCQTWTSGQTLPSGRYLQHQPQYFLPTPAFPLSRELASMEAQAGGAGLPGGPGVLPPPVPGGGVVPPPPLPPPPGP